MLFKWSYTSLQLCWLLTIKWLSYFDYWTHSPISWCAPFWYLSCTHTLHLTHNLHTTQGEATQLCKRPRWKNFGLDMCLTSRIWVSRSVPLLGQNRPFPTPIQDGILARLKTTVFDRSWKQMALTKKRWTNLETQILEVRHMSRPKFFHPGSPISISKLTFLNTCVASLHI